MVPVSNVQSSDCLIGRTKLDEAYRNHSRAHATLGLEDLFLTLLVIKNLPKSIYHRGRGR